MQVGQDGVPIGLGPRWRIGNGCYRCIGAVNDLKAASCRDPPDADELTEVMRLRVDSHLAFRSVKALIVNRFTDGGDVVTPGGLYCLSPEVNGDVSGLHGVGQDAIGSKTASETVHEIIVF